MRADAPLARCLVLFLVAGSLAVPELPAAEIALAERWRAPDAGGKPFRRLLAVGITSDAAARRKFEDRFVSLLRGRDVACLTSYSLFPVLPAAEDRQKTVDTLLAQQVDGLITVSLVPLAATTAEEWAASWRQGLGEESRVRPYLEAALQRSVEEASLHGVEVDLWNAATGERVWSARTTGHKIKKLRKQAPRLVEDVINELIDSRLL